METCPACIFFDGACEPKNPGGIATFGWLIKQDDQIVAWGYGEAKRGEGTTNNLAEYHALLSALQAAQDLAIHPTSIQGDSQLVVNQVNGSWRINKPHLAELANRVKEFNPPPLGWIPREQNEAADKLSRKAYQIAQTKDGPWSVRFKRGGHE